MSGNRKIPSRTALHSGAGLLGLALIAHVMLGPWAARWYLAVLWLAIAAGWFAARLRKAATGGLPFGFAALAAAVVVRALGWSSPWILGPLYALAAAAAAFTVVATPETVRTRRTWDQR